MGVFEVADAVKRGGRRANAEQRREHVVKIRLSDEEYVQITALAEAMGVTRPRVFTRAVETGGQVFDRVAVAQERARRVDAQMSLRVLAGVANNLNQLTHSMHAGEVVDAREVSATLRRVQEITERLHQVLDESSGGA